MIEYLIAVLLIVYPTSLILAAMALAASRRALRENESHQKTIETLRQQIADLSPPLHAPSPKDGMQTNAPPDVKATPIPKAALPTPASPAQPPPLPIHPPPAGPINPPTSAPTLRQTPPKTAFSLEMFMGAKLFAWLGGLAMFFGIIFFVKYAFERNLIPAGARVGLGYLTALALLGSGLRAQARERFHTLAHALMATGIVALYGVTYAAHAYYHFEAFAAPQIFALMCLFTTAAFVLAVRHHAQVIAALGMLGGFLTPILIPSVQDQALGLFGYIALLDIGVLACARQKPWRTLPAFAAIGTAITQVLWFGSFFKSGNYDVGHQTFIPILILTGFAALFALASWAIRQKRSDDVICLRSTALLNSVAMVFAFYFLSFDQIASRPFLLYGFILSLNAIAIAINSLHPRLTFSQLSTALMSFLHLAFWTHSHLQPQQLNTALWLYLVFGAIHAGYPVIRQRFFNPAAHEGSLQHWFGPAALVMMWMALCYLPNVPALYWVMLMLANLLVIGVATHSGRIAPTLASLAITFIIVGCWLDDLPSNPSSSYVFLAIVLAFSAVFVGAGFWLSKIHPQQVTAQRTLPILTALLPFVLLIMAFDRLQLNNPCSIFSVGLLLVLLLLTLAHFSRLPWLATMGCICSLALQASWLDVSEANLDTRWVSLAWILTFHAVFIGFPLLHRRRDPASTILWITACLSSIGHFLLTLWLVRTHFHQPMHHLMGLVPFGFAIPSLALMMCQWKRPIPTHGPHLSQLAWLGGTALLFITLIFPIQFKNDWLTVSWALEGAALIWLFRRLPHRGLKWVGITLLATAFWRLALNPSLLTSCQNTDTLIFNRHFYIYGVTIASFIAASRLLRTDTQQPRHHLVTGLLQCMAGILLFVLLNIQIADTFTEETRKTVLFSFGNHFARDMTYSIAWGLFSLGLLGFGILKSIRIPRYAAITLLGTTLLKVFLHDLSQIQSIYRIGALIGVAIIAFAMSYLYQKFVNRMDDTPTE